jgi:hypothetical protein
VLKIDIIGFGLVGLKHLVSDFTGTLSVNGRLLPRVRGRLLISMLQMLISVLICFYIQRGLKLR